jgi:ABC-type branched-subunit amino acid transport system substrate-binding protein
MMRNTKLGGSALFAVFCAGAVAACNSIVGLDDLSISDASGGKSGASNNESGSAGTNTMMPEGGAQNVPTGGTGNVPGEGGGAGEPVVVVGECKTNQDCIDKFSADPPENSGSAGAGGDGSVAAVCVKPEQRCVPLLSEDCDTITGDYTNDNAIIVGSLFSTKGAQAATNIQRQQAAMLAVEQMNAVGGIPPAPGSDDPRPLVMVSCDEVTNLVRSAEHLVKDLKVPAIVGPNTSQDTLDVSKVTVQGGTVVMTPTAVASSIVSLNDKDLTWLMVPSDVQRAPLMISQLNDMETALKAERSLDTIKLGIVFRNDALGIGTRTSLNSLKLNGKALTDAINLGNNVQIDGYDGTAADQAALVSKYLTFKPDIIVLAGTAEAVSKVMVPLEAQWVDTNRPHYVLIDSTKVPELITATTNNEDLRVRVRGTGLTPGPSGKDTPTEAYEGFKIDYALRFPGGSPTISGMGPSHDAAYAIGLALAATKNMPVSGASVALGLRKLASGPTKLTTLGTNVLAAFQKLGSNAGMTAVGTFGVLDWDNNGAVKGGTLEMWCIGGTPEKPVYQSSGLLFDIMSQSKSGAYKQCGQL